MRLPHAKFLIAGGLIIGTICYLMFSGINTSMVYYYTVTELKASADSLAPRGVRVSGHVLPGSIEKDDSGSKVEFSVFDKETNQSIFVTYSGIIPDTFKDSSEVVVEGLYHPESDSFKAHTLLAKCPSKYEEERREGEEGYPASDQVSSR